MDEKCSMWYMCGLCVPVTVIYGRPFTSGFWIEQVELDYNKRKIARNEHR